MSKILGLNVSLYISSLAQKAKSIQIHPPYTRLPSPVPTGVKVKKIAEKYVFRWSKLDFHGQIWAREIYQQIIIRVLNKNLKFSKISNFHQLQSNFLGISIYFTENLRVLFPVKNGQL